MSVKIVDGWMIKHNPDKGNTTNVYHLCKGNPEKVEFMEATFKKIKKMAGMWPVKDGKCFACEEEVPPQVMVYVP